MSKCINQIMAMDPTVKVVYEGPVFTVAVAEVMEVTVPTKEMILTLPVHQGGAEWIRKMWRAEGVSRKSHLDKYNREVAHEIAKGRALKALSAKVLFREKIRHRFMG